MFDSLYFPDDTDRVDGIAKVTGKAKYFAEFDQPGLTYGVLVTSTITKGRITGIDSREAMRAPGVISVLSHLNRPAAPGYEGEQAPAMRIFYSDRVHFNGQPVALVVADTFERATHAASLVRIAYEKEAFNTDFENSLEKVKKPKNPAQGQYKRGEEDAYKKAAVSLEADYTLPLETHNPMELHGILAFWSGAEQLTVYAKTQGVKATQSTLARTFGLKPEQVRVLSEFVGGGFGMALRTWPLEIAAVMAARQTGRPVKLVITRNQMFTMVGNRPSAWQRIGLGADRQGKLTGITHHSLAQSSVYEDFMENITGMSKFMYGCANVNTTSGIIPLDLSVPIWMRGPGEATGAFALESAIDELAFKLGMDPLEFRMLNDPDTDLEKNRSFSDKNIKEAYRRGAEAIGWKERSQQPGKIIAGDWQIGYGVSTGVFGAFRRSATVKAIMSDQGNLVLQSAASDIGPGTGTGMVRIASGILGIPANQISFELGDSSLPPAPSQGGSSTLSTVGAAVNDVCIQLLNNLKELAVGAGLKADAPHTEILKKNKLPYLEVTKESKGGAEQAKYSMYSFSIHFVQVKVHRRTGVVRVSKIVSVGDAGKIVSPKTAKSQMVGGAVGGIGMALTEEAVIDHRFGRYVNNNFGDYHVPVHADVPDIQVIFIDKPDPHINPMGAKGMGEIALIGFSAAVANAVFNATGKRIRSLPITPDKVLEQQTI